MNFQRDFTIDRGENVRERRGFEVSKGMIQSFRVQLEVSVDGRWRPVIRWDTSHGFVDCDCYTLNGATKKTILFMKFDEGLTMAQNNLNQYWSEYANQFLKGEFPSWHEKLPFMN